MKQDRKFLGMTIPQLGILAGLAGCACLLFASTGVLALRTSLGRFLSGAPQPTSVGLPTSTPFALPTTAPTATSTPVPYEQLIPAGWTQHKTGLVELWLPTEFKSAGAGASSGIAGNSVIVELALVASSAASPFKTTVTVAYEPMTASTLDEFVSLRLANIPDGINLAEHHKVRINTSEAYRLVFETTNNNVSTNDLLFVFQDGGTIWYVKYTSEITDFFEMLPTFEQSIKTFRMVK